MTVRVLAQALLVTAFTLASGSPLAARAEGAARTVELTALDAYDRPTGKIVLKTYGDRFVHVEVCPPGDECVHGGSFAKEDFAPLLASLRSEAEFKQAIKAGGVMVLTISAFLLSVYSGPGFVLPFATLGLGTLCTKLEGELNATGRCATSLQDSLALVDQIPVGKTRRLSMHADLGEFVKFLRKIKSQNR